ncbi:MAG: hypothetical protein EOO07_25975 [Chitinophagaceae bacterium]|nr:MAG: hypothetical protein EOO07_25975 [Chitinophagaceae bacterium]
MKLSDNLHKLLPFGYLFLVVLGILKESIFYYQIGINILKYSSLMDILISPIATLTSNLIVFVAVIIFAIILYAYPAFLAKRLDKKWAQKLSGLKYILMKSLMIVAIITGIVGAVTLIYITDNLRKSAKQINE